MSVELTKTDGVKNIFLSFPEIMRRNTLSVKKCNEAGQALLDTIGGEGMSETVDLAAADFLKKVNTALKNMDERHKPITQIFDKVCSFFTSQEKEVGPKNSSTIPGKLVAECNEYIKLKYEEEQKRKKEAEQRVSISSEKVSYQ